MPNQIPITDSVNVQITINDQAQPPINFNIALLVGNSTTIPIATRIQSFANLASVATYFGTSAQEYVMAVAFFAQSPSPPLVKIGRWVSDPTHATIKTNPYTLSISSIATITNGSFILDLDGSSHNITGVDFTGVSSAANVAGVLQDAIQAIGSGAFTLATVTAVGNYFIISGGTTGSTATAVLPTTEGSGTDLTISGTLNLGSGVVVNGLASETPQAALQAISLVDDNYYGIAFTNVIRDRSEIVALAAYVQGLIKVFINVSNDPNMIDSVNYVETIAYQIEQLGYDRTMNIYDNDATLYPDAAFLSAMFTVNYYATNQDGLYNPKFKQLVGIPAVPLTLTQLNLLRSYYVNTIYTQGNFAIFGEGFMSSGRYFDIRTFVDWLQNYIIVNVFNVLLAGRVPYDDAGTALLENGVKVSLQQGVLNGGLTALAAANGISTIPAYTTSVAPVSTIPPSMRANRISPPINFTAQLGNNINFASVIGTVNI